MPPPGRRSRRSALARGLTNICCCLALCALIGLCLHSVLRPGALSDLAAEWPSAKEERLGRLVFELNRTINGLHLAVEEKQGSFDKLQAKRTEERVQLADVQRRLNEKVQRFKEGMKQNAAILDSCNKNTKALVDRLEEAKGQLATAQEAAHTASEQLDDGQEDKESPVHLSPVCGRWQEQYRIRHQQLCDASLERGAQRFLTYRCDWSGDGPERPCGTLGEMLLGMVSTLAISLVTDRAFILHWEGADKFFDVGEINWRYTEDIRIQPSKPASRAALKIPDLPGLEPIQAGDIVTLNLTDIEGLSPRAVSSTFAKLKKASNIVVTWNRGLTVALTATSNLAWGKALRAMGLRPPFVFGCLLRYLLKPQDPQLGRQPTPKPDNRLRLSIGLYLRPPIPPILAPANTSAGDEAQLKHVVRCMKKLARFWASPYAQVERRAFGGSNALLRKLKQQYPEIEVQLREAPSGEEEANSREEDEAPVDFETELSDWLQFSKSQLFVFHDEAFAKTAAMYSLQPMSSWMVPHTGSAAGVFDFCSPEAPTGVLKMGDV